jgi:hypothetical protein
MANEITLSVGLKWQKNNQVVSGSVSETYTQVGNAAIGQIQSINSTTEQIELAEISGTKYLMLKNMAPKSTAANPQPTIYVDTVTPVVTSAVTAIVIAGGMGSFALSGQDTWYAIAVAAVGTPGPETVALPVDLSVVAVEQ